MFDFNDFDNFFKGLLPGNAGTGKWKDVPVINGHDPDDYVQYCPDSSIIESEKQRIFEKVTGIISK